MRVRQIGVGLMLFVACAPAGERTAEMQAGFSSWEVPETEPVPEAVEESAPTERVPDPSILTRDDVLLLEYEDHPPSPDGLPLQVDLTADLRTLRVSLINRGRDRTYWCGRFLDEDADFLDLYATNDAGESFPSIPCTGAGSHRAGRGPNTRYEAKSLAPGQRQPLATFNIHRVDENWVSIASEDAVTCWIVPAKGTRIRASFRPGDRRCSMFKEMWEKEKLSRWLEGTRSPAGGYFVPPPTRELFDGMRWARPRLSNTVALHPAELPLQGAGNRRPPPLPEDFREWWMRGDNKPAFKRRK